MGTQLVSASQQVFVGSEFSACFCTRSAGINCSSGFCHV